MEQLLRPSHCLAASQPGSLGNRSSQETHDSHQDCTPEYLADIRFHQSLNLPPNPSAGRTHQLRVTYSDYGYRNLEDPGSEAVVLFCGPLLSSRYYHLAKDQLAKEKKIRIINADRPGIGGSGDVDAENRIKVWLETVPALLEHLDIKHVALVCQSGGTLYALNTLLYLRHILHPTKPYVAICAPWIHPLHSGATAMQAMKIFPDPVVGRFHTAAQFFHNNLAPTMGFSSSLLSALLPVAVAPVSGDTNPDVGSFEETLRKKSIDYAYAENIQGMSQEALLFLKRGSPDSWGPWEDYDRYVPMLAELEGHLPCANKLKVDVFYSETDVMIGTSRGPQWFDACWRSERRGDRIEYSSCTIMGADHDSILDLKFGLPRRIFDEIANSFLP